MKSAEGRDRTLSSPPDSSGIFSGMCSVEATRYLGPDSNLRRCAHPDRRHASHPEIDDGFLVNFPAWTVPADYPYSRIHHDRHQAEWFCDKQDCRFDPPPGTGSAGATSLAIRSVPSLRSSAASG